MSAGAEPAHHLLRTLAAVAPSTRILLLGDDGRHLPPLRAMGFDVTEAPASDAAHDWVVAWNSHDDGAALASMLETARMALAPGGWVWVATAGVDPDALQSGAAGAGLALAEAPAHDVIDGLPVVRAIFRRVDGGSVA